VYTFEAAHNPEVAGSNPAPATGKGALNGAFRLFAGTGSIHTQVARNDVGQDEAVRAVRRLPTRSAALARSAKSLLEPRVVANGEVVVSSRVLAEPREQLEGPSEVGEGVVAVSAASVAKHA
jgi:hypothetical protein